MAKVDIKFLSAFHDDDYLQVYSNTDESFIQIVGKDSLAVPTSNDLEEIETYFDVWLDKSTAIKFAKALRTEINKIKD